MQASVIELITDSKFIRILEGKSRNIFISNILDVNKTCSAKNVSVNRVNTNFYSIYFSNITMNNERNDFILSLRFIHTYT